MRLIDGHTHVASTHFIPTEFMDGIVDNMMEQMHLSPVPVARERAMARLLAGYQDHDADIQVREMDKLGIEKSVLLLPDFTYALKGNAYTVDEMFARHWHILQRHPGRFEVFAGVDPRWGRDGLSTFQRGVEQYGFRGLKLYPPCGYQADDPALTPFYEYCQEHHLPVLLHTGPTSPVLAFGPAVPMHVDGPARRYTNISFILAHGAVNYQEECVNLCRYRPNVYLDLSGAQWSAANLLHLADFLKLFSNGINHKIIFGTDWPINKYHLNSTMIDLLRSEDQGRTRVPAREAQLILAGNIERILAKVRVARPAADGAAA
ncbi:amidohydrolase family protein [Massilia sp. PAMC28688]|uniref:amidohydrolase family protein n=1 Tax=Massilia sp. PAMC28688 TaxID=2861283 RepID=UPI001C63507F|nr:amidohydrolase family protein [Massilia sp. PAMC28688]QYF92629.1 amidohydrolase family protein [Massilia sp. PAMC28688]